MTTTHSLVCRKHSPHALRVLVERGAASRLLSMLLLVMTTVLLSSDAMCALPVAWLKNVKPTVQVGTAAKGPWQNARERHRLRFGNFVRTRGGGKTLVLFSNGTQLVLSSGTQIQLVSPPSAKEPLVVRVFGTLSEVFVKAKGNTQIRTAAGTAAVRGTEYLVRVVNDTATEVTVTEGAVAFYNERGSVLISANQQSRATTASAPTQPVAVDPSGLIQWTADITALPVEFEMPFSSLGAGQLQSRKNALAATVRANPGDAAAHGNLARVLYDLGEYADAVAHFSEAVRAQPEQVSWHIGLGRARRGQGDAPAARAAFERARSLAPNDVTPRIGLALTALAEGDEEAALTVLTGSDDALSQAVLGLIAMRQGSDEDAVRRFQAALRDNPQLYQAESLLALALLSRNQVAQAESAARRAVALAPSSAQAQGSLAMTLFFAGKSAEATRAANRAVALNPLSPFALLTQGRALLAQQKTDEARDALQQAQALAPDLPILNAELGAVYLRLDMPQKAESVYRRAVELRPDSADAHSGLGLALQKQGRLADALAEHRRAVELDPANSTARSNLAAYYIERGDFTAAQEQLQTGVLDTPERGILYVRLAELSLYQQNLRAAADYARRAVRLLPASALAHYQLGRVYLEQERVIQAEQQFRQAVVLDPDFPEARYALGLTREQSQGSIFGRSFSRGAVMVGSAASALSVQNLQTPGAQERIQALSQDPTVARVASRSFGDTQVVGVLADDGSHEANVSHLSTTNDQRGVIGVTATRRGTDGVRDNADREFGRAAFVLGQKQQDNPSSFFITGQLENGDRGQNTDFRSNTSNDSLRVRYSLPRVLGGYNFAHGRDSRTRVLVQASQHKRLQTDIVDPLLRKRFDFQSLNMEARHDRRVGDKHRVTVGLFAGTRTRDNDSRSTLFRDKVEGRVRALGLYARDEWKLNPRLTLIGDVQLQDLSQDITGQLISPALPDPLISRVTRRQTLLLPRFVVAYQPDERTGLRLRVRRLAGTIEDFQLLRPTDVFTDIGDLPSPQLFSGGAVNGTGRSIEVELDHTFRDASFLRVALIHEYLARAGNDVALTGDYRRVRQTGLRASYEGTLSASTAFFVRLDLNRARDVAKDTQIVQVPRYSMGAGIQYLSRDGYFLEPLLLLQGSRRERLFGGSRLDAFETFSLRAGKRWGLRSVLFVELNNLLDTQYSVLQERQPGRQLSIGAVRRF